MLQLVKLALSKPYTFVVLAILILLSGMIAWFDTPTDIFPDIKIPVIAAVWTYRGLPPEDMAGRVIYYYERQLSTTVNDIDHIESQSLNGIGIVKIFFQPGVDIRTATAQVTSASQTVLKQMPPGITPPLILNYNASTVPILQLGAVVEGSVRAEDLRPRPELHPPGAGLGARRGDPVALWRQERQIQIDLDPAALQARHLSATDVGAALAAQNQIVPAGTTKIGHYEYNFRLNNSPAVIDHLNDLPIKTVDGSTVYMRDVAHVHDGSPPQRNVVRVDGGRAVLMTVLKSGAASTIAIVDQAKALLPKLKETLARRASTSQPLADQSLFVKAAVSGVIREGVIAATLTSLMILLFLGQLALDGHHRGLDPAGDPGGGRRAVGGRRDAQHHDAGRPGARRRHPRRRCDRHDRKHQLASRARQARPPVDPRWRRADRRPRIRLAAVHLHRVRADVLPARRGRLPVRADGEGGRVRDDRVVRAVAHDRAGDGQLPAARSCDRAYRSDHGDA